MIGETITARYGNRHAWLVWLIVGLFLIAGDFAMDEHHLLILAAAPIAVGFALAATRREPLVVHFDDDGIEVISPEREFIRYDSIEAITTGNEEGLQFSIAVLHRKGALNLPPNMDIDSRDVFRFLRRELPEDETIGPPPSLRRFMQSQDEAFGEDRVFFYRSLAEPRIDKGLTALSVCVALFSVSVIWNVVGAAASRDYSPWAGFGIIMALGSGIGLIVFAVNRGSSNRSAGDGGIVIAPTGIAVEQEGLLGIMRWEEISDIQSSRARRSLQIHFLGGLLTLRDIYHRSLRLVRERLLDYWEGPIDDY